MYSKSPLHGGGSPTGRGITTLHLAVPLLVAWSAVLLNSGTRAQVHAASGEYCIKSTAGSVDYYLTQTSPSSLDVKLSTACSCSSGLWILDPSSPGQQCLQAKANLKYLHQISTSGTSQYALHSDSNACSFGGITDSRDFSKLSTGCIYNDFKSRYLSIGSSGTQHLMISGSTCDSDMKWSFVSAAAIGCGTPVPLPSNTSPSATPTSGIYCLQTTYGGTKYINFEAVGSNYDGRTAGVCNCNTAWELTDKGGGKFTMMNRGTQQYANTVGSSINGASYGSTFSGAWSWSGGCIGFAGSSSTPAQGTAIVKNTEFGTSYGLGSCNSDAAVTPVTPSGPCISPTKTETGSDELTPAADATATLEAGIPLGSHDSFSRIVPWSEVKPLSGSVMTSSSFSMSGGYSCGSTSTCCCTYGTVNIGDYIWFVPDFATGVTKMHKVTGAMNTYSSWPGAVTDPAGHKFAGAVHDSATSLLWMIPVRATHVVSVNVTSGGMNYCPNWPVGYVLGAHTFRSFTGFIQRSTSYFWMAPADMNMIVRYDMNDCTPTGYNSWPGGYTLGSKHATWAIYNWDHTMWLVPGTGTSSHIIKMNLWDLSMTLHSLSGLAGYSGGSTPFRGGTFDGQSAWALAWDANMIVKMDQTTDAVTGINSWPVGYTHGGILPLNQALFDGKYVWCLPYSASHILRIDTTDDTMIGFATSEITDWHPVRGATLDFATQSIFLPPNVNGDKVVQLRFDATPTREQRDLILQDGRGMSGIVPYTDVVPFEGDQLRCEGFATPNGTFNGLLLIGEYLWLPPLTAEKVYRVHKVTGVATTFNSWPGGSFILNGASSNFRGGSYDKVRERIWMVPFSAKQVVYIDVSLGTAGAMSSCPTSSFPSYFAGGVIGNKAFSGSFIERDRYFWMSSNNAGMIVRTDMTDCSMLGYNSWPSGAYHTLGGGAIYDGDHHGFFAPHWTTNIFLKINLLTGGMTAYDQTALPGWTSVTGASFSASTFDGQSLWTVPRESVPFIVRIDKDTGVMNGLSSWPTGFPGVSTNAFGAAVYDGKYVWALPWSDNKYLIRIDVSTAIMTLSSSAVTFGAVAAVVDFSTKSLWTSLSILQRLTFTTSTLVPVRLRLHDGISSSSRQYEAMPLAGPEYQVQAFDNWGSAGINKTEASYYSGLLIGDYLWLCPVGATATLTKVNKHTGVMEQYSTTWPPGFVGGTWPFTGLVFDGASIWMVPHQANMVIKVDPSSSGSAGLESFTGFPPNTGAYHGGACDGQGFVWMMGQTARHIARVATVDGTMIGFDAWPTGFSWAPDSLRGAAFDSLHIWACPYRGTWVVGINAIDGSMVGFDTTTWSSAINYGALKSEGGVVVEETSDLYVIPAQGDSLVKLHTPTGTATGYKSWPPGFVASTTVSTDVARGGIFDGQYLWMSDFDLGKMIIRFDTHTGTMNGYAFHVGITKAGTPGAFIGMSFDPETKSIWFIPFKSSVVLRLSEQSYTQSASPTNTETAPRTPSQDATMTMKPSLADSSSAGSASSSEGTHSKGSSSSASSSEPTSGSSAPLPAPSSLLSREVSLSTGVSSTSRSSSQVATTTAPSSASSSEASSTSALPLLVEEDPATTLNSATVSSVSNVLGNKEAAIAVVGTGTAAAAVGTFASPTAASQAVRVGMVAGVVECAYSENNVEPSLLNHPIQFHLFGSDAFAKLTGSISATTLVFILLPCLAIALHLAVSNHTEDAPLPDWRLSLQEKILGTLLSIGLGYFAPSVVEATLLILTHGQNPGQKAIAVLCLLVCVAPLVAAGYIIIRRFDDLVEVKSKKKDKEKDRTKYEYSNHGPKLWVEAIGPFMDGTRDPVRLATRLYFFEEIGITFLLGILSGIKPSGAGQCSPLAVCMVILCLVHCIYLAVFRPHIGKLEFLFVATTGVLLLVMAGIALAATLTPNPSDSLMKALGFVALIESTIFFVQAAVLGFWAYTVGERRKVKEREAAAAAAVLAPVSVTTATSPPQGATSPSSTTPSPSTRPPKSASTPGAGGGNNAPLLQPPVRHPHDEGARGAWVNPLQRQSWNQSVGRSNNSNRNRSELSRDDDHLEPRTRSRRRVENTEI